MESLHDNIERAVQVRLSSIITEILKRTVQETLLSVFFVALACGFFTWVHWRLVRDFMYTLLFNVMMQSITEVVFMSSEFLVILNLVGVFLLIQRAIALLQFEIGNKILSSVRFILVGHVIESMQRYLTDSVLIIVIVLLLLRLFMTMFRIENNDLVIFFHIAIVQSVQELIMQNIPTILAIPLLFFLMYTLQHVARLFQSPEISDFITYQTASRIQVILYQFFEKDYVVILILVCLSYQVCENRKIQHFVELCNIIFLYVSMDFFFELLKPMYTTDPFLCLIGVLFLLQSA